MSTDTSTDPRIHDFAVAVRANLADLEADEIDDLTDGLEADLVDQADDLRARGASDEHDLGDPAVYAFELRSAAGLPARAGSRTLPLTTARATFRRWSSEARIGVLTSIRSTRAGRGTLDIVISLRPVWWLLRGWALFHIAWIFLGGSTGALLPTTLPLWVLLLGFIVGSVQWGRGRWMPRPWLRVFKVLLSMTAVFALALLLGRATSALNQQASDTAYSVASPIDGLSMNGVVPISNIFAYDAAGKPLTGVQLFDQDGSPIVTTSNTGSATEPAYDPHGGAAYVPSAHVLGDPGWNVFPLDLIRLTDSGGRADAADAVTAVPPFVAVRPLTDGSPAASSPSTTPAPPDSTSSPTTAPSPAP